MYTGVRLKEKVRPMSRQIRGISHKHRLAIIYLLAHQPMNAYDIVANIDLPSNLVSHHLKALLDGGWVMKRRIGRLVTYQLNEKAFLDFTKLLKETPFGRILLSGKLPSKNY